jgi:protein MAK16
MIIRRRRLKLNQMEKYEPIKTKFERREKQRERKAERAANLEISIEKELLNRLKEGVYPKEIYNIDQKEFEKAVGEEEVEEEKEYMVDEEISELDSEESEEELEREIVEADLDEVDDLEDVDEMSDGEDSDGGDVKRYVLINLIICIDKEERR